MGENRGIVQINTEEIMKEIRENIKTRGYSNDVLKFSDIKIERDDDDSTAPVGIFDPKVFARQMYKVNNEWGVIYGSNPLGGGLQGFVKRVVRKFVSFLFVPVVEQVNTFNYATSESLMQVYSYIMTQNGTTDSDDAEADPIANMKSFMEHQEKTIEELQTKIIRLEEKIEELESKTGYKN